MHAEEKKHAIILKEPTHIAAVDLNGGADLHNLPGSEAFRGKDAPAVDRALAQPDVVAVVAGRGAGAIFQNLRLG